MGDAVADAVKTGYDVIADNIRQGREAAARFRQGEYNIRDVPADIEAVLSRLIHLARELNTTTFDVFERLLKELRSYRPPEGQAAAGVPPFRTPGASSPPPTTATTQADPGRLKLTVRFAGAGKAVARTASLERPRRPTTPQDLTVASLAMRDGGGPAISGVKFETDVSVEGLIAVVTLPKGLAPGVYSGLVHARQDELPLGVLSIEIPR